MSLLFFHCVALDSIIHLFHKNSLPLLKGDRFFSLRSYWDIIYYRCRGVGCQKPCERMQAGAWKGRQLLLRCREGGKTGRVKQEEHEKGAYRPSRRKERNERRHSRRDRKAAQHRLFCEKSGKESCRKPCITESERR